MAQQFPEGRCQCRGAPTDFERFFFKHIGLCTYYAEHIHSIQAVNKSVGMDASPAEIRNDTVGTAAQAEVGLG